MLTTSLRRKKVHHFTCGSGFAKQRFACHDDQLQDCFPDKDVSAMDKDQLLLLLLSHKYNVRYNAESMNVTQLRLSV